jgi:hypothetical protein
VKNSFLKGSLKWGAILAGLNVVTALVLPMANTFDSQAILIISPVTGFVGGVVLHILNFLASEAIKYSEYRLTKVEGLAWSNHTAVRRVRIMTASGLLGGGLFLGVVAIIAFTIHGNEFGPVPFAPLFVAIGFGLGVITYFVLWAIGYFIPGRDKVITETGKLTITLKQLYQKWKSHDYRS